MSLAVYRRNVLPSLFNNFYNDEFSTPAGDRRAASHGPPADVYADEDGVLHLDFDLPGVAKKDINVELNNGVLTVDATQEAVAADKKTTHYTRERHHGSFHRSFRLGSAYDPQAIKAVHKDGVLKVTVDKKEESKPLSVVVQ